LREVGKELAREERTQSIGEFVVGLSKGNALHLSEKKNTALSHGRKNFRGDGPRHEGGGRERTKTNA